MEVDLLNDMERKLDNELLNWVRIQKLIPSGISSSDLLEFSQTHMSVKSKITFTDYHYHILNQLYRPADTPREVDTDSWARAEMHCIVINLYSALDSLAHEINLAYQFGINISCIHIHHDHQQPKQDCVRCRLDTENDSLTSFINNELNNQWFETFRKLRNQITHKSLPIILVRIGGVATQIMIPNDPTKTNPQYQDYSQKLEINQYCLDRRNDISRIVEKAYELMEPKIKTTYNL